MLPPRTPAISPESFDTFGELLLWGAAEALHLSEGAREAPASRASHARLLTQARAGLGAAAFDAAWAAGQAAS